SEAVWRQTTEDFIRVLENAFWHFGGVPRTVVVDNLKAVDPEVDDLVHLRGLTNLQILWLVEPSVTDAAVAELKEQFPDMRIDPP
ncbi:MAG: hypothetical protein ACYTKD_13955, partial [Planctomycetota bacterium]